MKKIILIFFLLIILFFPYNLTKEKNIESKTSFITLPYKLNIVAKKVYNNRTNLEKLINKSKFYFNNNNFYNSITGLVSTNAKKIIDVSSYQGIIDWEKAKKEIDGVILRIGFGSSTIDGKLENNIRELQRLNIPYGIYLYSYAENDIEALKEAEFTLDIIRKYNLNISLGIYYDIEEFYVHGKKVIISKKTYQKIIETYINKLGIYSVGVYTYAKMYKNKLNEQTKTYVTWIAQYNYYFNYQKHYIMWQYSSTEKINGIKGNVDMNVMFN